MLSDSWKMTGYYIIIVLNTLVCPQNLMSDILYLWSKNIHGFVWRIRQQLRDCGDRQYKIMMGVNERVFMLTHNF